MQTEEHNTATRFPNVDTYKRSGRTQITTTTGDKDVNVLINFEYSSQMRSFANIAFLYGLDADFQQTQMNFLHLKQYRGGQN